MTHWDYEFTTGFMAPTLAMRLAKSDRYFASNLTEHHCKILVIQICQRPDSSGSRACNMVAAWLLRKKPERMCFLNLVIKQNLPVLNSFPAVVRRAAAGQEVLSKASVELEMQF